MGFCTLGLYEKAMPGTLTWEEKLTEGKRAGFDFLEMSIDESEEKLARLNWSRGEKLRLYSLSHDIGLPIDSICLSGHRKYPLGSGIPEIERRSLEIMDQAIGLASDLGIRIIQVAGYDVYYNEASTPSTKERFLENLYQSTMAAGARGVILALETMENSFMNTVEKAMYYVQTIHSPYLQVYPDIGNITNGTDNVTYDIRKGAGHIVAAHLKETKENVFRNLKYGEGRVDFAVAVRVLKNLGVRKFNAEFWYDGADNWRQVISSSHHFLRPLLDADPIDRIVG